MLSSLYLTMMLVVLGWTQIWSSERSVQHTSLSNHAECPSSSRNMYACLTRKDQAAAFLREQSGLFSFSQILIIFLTGILKGDIVFYFISNMIFSH